MVSLRFAPLIVLLLVVYDPPLASTFGFNENSHFKVSDKFFLASFSLEFERASYLFVHYKSKLTISYFN